MTPQITTIKRTLLLFTLTATFTLLASSVFALPAQGVTPINNRYYAPAVMKLIEGAKKEIKLMLYQVRFYDDYPDSDSNNMIDALISASKRGVNVAVVIEASGWNPENDAQNLDVARRLANGGVEVWRESPDITSHQKVLIVDDDITVVASLNWSHYSLRVNNEVASIIWSREFNSAARKFFYKMAGESERVFPKNKSSVTEDEIEALGFNHLPAVDVIPLINEDYFYKVIDAINNAQKNIDVVQRSASYYLTNPFNRVDPLTDAPDPSETNLLLKALINAANKGVKVRVILDQGENGPGENEDFANRLYARGVTVYYDSPTTQTHAKMLVIDDDKVVVGSTNWSYYAVSGAGNEASVLIVSPEVNKQYKQYIDEVLKGAEPFKPAAANLKAASQANLKQ